MDGEWQSWLDPVVAIAQKAGREILPYFYASSEEIGVTQKRDHTLLTKADVRANEIIFEGLHKLTPSIPVLSEEGVIPSYEIRKNWTRYWLVDPLDGTRGFVEHSDEFTVNIALIDQHHSRMGVVYAPAKNSCYFAIKGKGAFKQIEKNTPIAIHTKSLDWKSFQVLLGRYLRSPRLPDLFKQIPGCDLIRMNSSLKFCWIAERKGDIYPRFGNTSEWDTAAAQCVLEAAGGAVLDFNGNPLHYNTSESLVNPAFVAFGDPSQKNKIIDLVEQKRREK